MATAGANVRFRNANSFTMNSVYNYSKLEYEQKGFKFKYVSEKELQKAIKRVRRERKKLQDEKQWIQFLQKKHEELSSPVMSQLQNEIARQQSHTEQTLTSNSVQLNGYRNDGPGENIVKCTCGYMKNTCKEQESSTSGLSISDKAHYFSKFSPQTHVPGTVLEENSETEEPSPGYLFSSCDGHNGTDIHMHNYQQSVFLTSTTMKRLQHLSECIQKIGKSLIAVHDKEPISDESAEREHTRNTEFAARFTRNYLYRIHRQEKELEKIFSDGISDFILIEKKISSVYQTVIQAVEVYQRHILKCTSTSTFKHLDLIVRIIHTILSYVEKLIGNHNFPYRMEIQNNCDNLIKVLTQYNKLKSEYKSSSRSIKSVPVKPIEKCSNLLYMYEPKIKPAKWKKPSALLAKKKFGNPQSMKHKKTKTCLSDVDIGSSVIEGGIRKEKGAAGKSNSDSRPQSDHMAYEGADLKRKLSSDTTVKKSKSTQQMWPSNVKLICVTSSESSEIKTKESVSQGLIRKECVRPEDMTRLNVSEQAKAIATTYRKEFMKFSKLPYNIKETGTERPWELISSISDRIANEIVKGTCEHLEVDILLQKMFDLEFKE